MQISKYHLKRVCSRFLLLLQFCCSLVMLQALQSCYQPDYSQDDWEIPEGSFDSLDFMNHHHYGLNYNFKVLSDSLPLQSYSPLRYLPGTQADTHCLFVGSGDLVAVADIMLLPGEKQDSVWVKVARDQETMGWIPEKMLLDNVVPNDSISEFIHVFSNKHLIYLLSVVLVFLVLYLVRRMRRNRFQIVHFNDIASFYPTGLCLVIAGAATLYATIQKFVPDQWVAFYYDPTLNPFGQPWILETFLISVWLIILLALAVVDEVRRQLSFSEGVLYLSGLLGVSMLCYLFFSVTTLYYIGYLFFAVYVIWALQIYYKNNFSRYLCGHCGAKMSRKGRCPKCGAWNE